MKGFAYDMITLEMAIEEEGKPSGAIRIDDITRLIQVYMVSELLCRLGQRL